MEFARMIVSYISMGMYKCFGIVIPPDKKHSLKIAVLTLTLFVARSQTYTKNSVLLDGSLQLIKHPAALLPIPFLGSHARKVDSREFCLPSFTSANLLFLSGKSMSKHGNDTGSSYLMYHIYI